MTSSSIPKASATLESLDYVKEAGAAPTDEGHIPAFQIKLESAVHLTDATEKQVENILKQELHDFFSNGETTIQTSKDVIEEGTEREVSCIWAFTYGSLGQFKQHGEKYNIIHVQEQWGIEAVPNSYTDPMKGAIKFKWSELPFSYSDFEDGILQY